MSLFSQLDQQFQKKALAEPDKEPSLFAQLDRQFQGKPLGTPSEGGSLFAQLDRQYQQNEVVTAPKKSLFAEIDSLYSKPLPSPAPEGRSRPHDRSSRNPLFAPLAHDTESNVTNALNNAYKMAGPVMWLLNMLDRPRATLAATAGALTRQWGADRIGKALAGEDHVSWEEFLPKEIMSPGSSASWGVLGSPTAELMGRKLMDSSYAKPTNLTPWLGFAADALLDPLNFVSMGVLTKSGTSGKMLKNLMQAHGDDIARATGIRDVSEIIQGLSKGDEAILGVLRAKEVPESSLSLAQKASEYLAPTLREQAERGQWALARFGPWFTPKSVNLRAANTMGKIREGIPKTIVGKALINRSGNELFDESARNLLIERRASETDLLENIAWLKDTFENLPEGERFTEKLAALGDITRQHKFGMALQGRYNNAAAFLKQIPEEVRNMDLWEVAALPDGPTKTHLMDLWKRMDPVDANAGQSFMHVFERRVRPLHGDMPETPGMKEFAEQVEALRDKYGLEMDQAGIPYNRISQVNYIPHVGAEKSEKLSGKVMQYLEEATPRPVDTGRFSVANTPPISVSSVPKDAVIVPEKVDKEGFLPKMLGKIYNTDAPAITTPHQLSRKMKWITDPETGQEFIGHTEFFALRNGIPEEQVLSRQATAMEIHHALAKSGIKDPLFETNPVQALLVAEIENERAIFGTKMMDWVLSEVGEDALHLGGKVRTLADHAENGALPQGMKVYIPGPPRFGSKWGSVHSVNWAEGTAKVHIQRPKVKGDVHLFKEIPLHQLVSRKDLETSIEKAARNTGKDSRFVRLALKMPSSYMEEMSVSQRVRSYVPDEAISKLGQMDFPKNRVPGNVPSMSHIPSDEKKLLRMSLKEMEKFQGKEFDFHGGARIYFAPGSGDETWENYVRHLISGGSGGDSIRRDRVTNLFYLEKVLQDPDVVVRQKNGRLLAIASFEETNEKGKNVYRNIVLEAGKDGKVRTVTAFPQLRGDHYKKIANSEDFELLTVSDRIRKPQGIAPDNLGGQTSASQLEGAALHRAGTSTAEGSDPSLVRRSMIPPEEGVVNTISPSREAFEIIRNIPVPPEKARVIEGIWKAHVAPREAMNELEKIWKGYTSLWKRYTLFPFMEYHVRNVVGDLWNGWLQGWDARSMASDLYAAMEIQKGKSFSLTTGVYGRLSGEQVLQAAKHQGVIGSGQYSEVLKKQLLSARDSSKAAGPLLGSSWQDDVTRAWGAGERRAGQLVSDMKLQPGATLKRGVKKGGALARDHLVDLQWAMEAGGFLEDNRRLGLFLHRLKKGDSYSEAAKAVTKALFDYNDITPIEKQIRTYAIPFYTWFRKNIPYQLEMLARKPGKIALLPKIKGHMEGYHDSRVPESLVPEWMKDGFPINMGRNDQGQERFALLQNWIPTVDLFSFLTDPSGMGQSVLSSLNPLVKVPAEQLLNKDFYFGNSIDTLRNSEDPWRMFSGNERTNYLGQDMSTSMRKWSELLPITRLLSTADRLNPMGVFDAPSGYSPAAINPDAVKTRPWHTEMTTGEKLTKFLTGLKVYPVDVQRQAMFEMLGVQRSGSEPGLTEGNLMKLLKRAYMEGDQRTAEHYRKLLEELHRQMLERQKDYRRYNEHRRQLQ
jgi:hypothetical protein